VCRAAEGCGYDGFSLYDVPSRAALECWTSLTYCLASTERLAAIPLVLANPLRNPALVAKMAADLQTLSSGRLVLGVGAGGSDQDLQVYGVGQIPLPARLERLEEALEVIRGLLSGKKQFHRGTHYTVEGLQLDPPPVPPPILIGGHGPRLLEVAARQADVINVGFDMRPDEWSRLKPQLDAERLHGPLGQSRLLLSHNMSIPETGDVDPATVEALIRAGVSWFFLVFPDLPNTKLLERFADRMLTPFKDSL
jgi:alkanesulfonate monooxygenase SsuD/methylene tetrahydromethanopterin reductase-like flavin-dependent oxidoreductase (luciferase family)